MTEWEHLQPQIRRKGRSAEAVEWLLTRREKVELELMRRPAESKAHAGWTLKLLGAAVKRGDDVDHVLFLAAALKQDEKRYAGVNKDDYDDATENTGGPVPQSRVQSVWAFLAERVGQEAESQCANRATLVQS